MKKLLSFVLAAVTVFSFCLTPFAASAAEDSDREKLKYYYNQLSTAESRAIYNALDDMLADGSLKTGTKTIDLVKEKVLSDTEYNKNSLTADFIAARDAFMLDNNVFYVNFDKLTLTQIHRSRNDHSYMVGIGRDEDYFADGIGAGNIAKAVEAFDGKVNSIAAAAGAEKALKDKIEKAYRMIIDTTKYALEKDADPKEYADYVRSPYGALVNGQSVCEGYARALKAVLDKMGVDNVLAQGYYTEGALKGPHMWNYVKMDDNRWYMLDATMEDANPDKENGYDFFLKTARSPEVKNYLPDGIVSVSRNSFEFRYPELSASDYTEMSDAFAFVDADGYKAISYKNMGVVKTAETGRHIISSLDGNKWFFYKNYFEFLRLTQGADAGNIDNLIDEIDNDNYFKEYTQMAYFAVTDINVTPPSRSEYDFSTLSGKESYYLCPEGIKIFDQVKVGEVIEFVKKAPYVTKKEPAVIKVDRDKEYTIVATYSEKLMPENSANPVTVTCSEKLDTPATVEWDGDRTITLKFKTNKGFGYITNYGFTFDNIMGVESRRAPNGLAFYSMNHHSFACPKVEGDISEIHSNVPALIANSDLSTEGWRDKDGNPVASGLPSRLALIAETITDENEIKDKIDKIEDLSGREVVSSRTYEISLTLCSGQVGYISGKPVKIFVPYPDGKGPASNTVFKAYHFKADGTPEEVDCIPVENGLIVMCSAFSPYTIVEVEKTANSQKAVMAVATGNGVFDIDNDYLKLDDGESRQVKITPDDGFVIESVELNGEKIEIPDSENPVIELKYSMLNEDGNILSATFVSKKLDTPQAPTTDPTDKPEEKPEDKPEVKPTKQPEPTKKPADKPAPVATSTPAPTPAATPVATPAPSATPVPSTTPQPARSALPSPTDSPAPAETASPENNAGPGNSMVLPVVAAIATGAVVIAGYVFIRKNKF